MSATSLARARREYARAARELWDRCYELAVTALEDAPDDLDLACETLCESVTEVEGAAHALLAVVADLPDAVVRPTSALVEADAAFSSWQRAFDGRLAGARARVELDRRPVPRPPAHEVWLGVIDTASAHAAGSGRRFDRARLALWRELVETAAAPPAPAPTRSDTPSADVSAARSASSSEEAPA